MISMSTHLLLSMSTHVLHLKSELQLKSKKRSCCHPSRAPPLGRRVGGLLGALTQDQATWWLALPRCLVSKQDQAT